MAPSIGHLHKLVVKNAKLLKAAWKNTQSLIQARVPAYLRGPGELIPIPVRAGGRQPVHPLAALRQSQSKYSTYSNAANGARLYTTTAAESITPGLKYDRQTFAKSRTAIVVNNLTGRAPFASTLRPNLSGGALRRTAGGYSLGSGRIGGARYFSNTPAAPAQIVQNVSQAMRAFFISGHKAQFSGVNPCTGEKRFRTLGVAQEKVIRTVVSLPKATPGSYVDFKVNPSITALTSMNSLAGYTTTFAASEQNLNTSGLLDVLSLDFSRALKDLAAILNDLKRLAALGDLPITYRSETASVRVHFPGCDGDSVEMLCQEIGIQRGIIHQDPDFDTFAGTEIALLFPLAPSEFLSEALNVGDTPPKGALARPYKLKIEPIEWQTMISQSHSACPSEQDIENDGYSIRSETGLEPFEDGNPWATIDAWASPEGYETMSQSSGDGERPGSPLEYHDFEGICKFIELCDGAKSH